MCTHPTPTHRHIHTKTQAPQTHTDTHTHSLHRDTRMHARTHMVVQFYGTRQYQHTCIPLLVHTHTSAYPFIQPIHSRPLEDSDNYHWTEKQLIEH